MPSDFYAARIAFRWMHAILWFKYTCSQHGKPNLSPMFGWSLECVCLWGSKLYFARSTDDGSVYYWRKLCQTPALSCVDSQQCECLRLRETPYRSYFTVYESGMCLTKEHINLFIFCTGMRRNARWKMHEVLGTGWRAGVWAMRTY